MQGALHGGSSDAGSTGLNLQAADTVVNVDLPWNPAILEQRIGRVHRMGQAGRCTRSCSSLTARSRRTSSRRRRPSASSPSRRSIRTRLLLGPSALRAAVN